MGTYYKTVEQYLDKIDPGAWVEIGVDRGEGSTQWFSKLAKDRNTEFYGVDADSDQIARITKSLSSATSAALDSNGQLVVTSSDVGIPDHVRIIHAKGEDFIKQWGEQTPDKKISLAYLDNFDWDYWLGREEESFVPIQKERYKAEMGIEMTNLTSQLTHLVQAHYLMPLMSDNSIIVCDDTWFHPHEGIFIGKCSAAIPFLAMHGYKVLHSQGYRQNSGAILGRFKNEQN